MRVWDIVPYSLQKDLGKSYNEAMQLIPDDDWCCLRDGDTSFLTSDYGHILHEYAQRNPDADLMTCYTNRISPLSKQQLLTGIVSGNTDMKYHLSLAEKQKRLLYKTTVINGSISGMLMMISKKKWMELPFPENGNCLGIDTLYSRTLQEMGKKILRCDGLYIFHSYRLLNGIGNKNHLLV